ncbi:MAG: methyltransferase domain-containing protein [Armatimonadetes bacterium]|nr:methyltransferase domain-containing protein [Candidatus Latescibacterota bacterium]NIO76788.1 methyltransferase domain-containing protein [Armatimonadota bacterium]NIO78668.1 methyltransferase domain-containing protein [Candidatus Latescibacterota bacterium]
MKQNIFDDPQFFAGYQAMREAGSGLNAVLEQPAMRTLLPPVARLRVLDLGCGVGELCRELLASGAASVVGIDLSEKMLECARQFGEGIRYVHSAIEDFDTSAGSFDLVVSSLTLHYVENYSDVARKVFKWLVPGGFFIFSIEHPMATAAQGIHPGWIRDDSGHKQYWAVDCYQDEGQRKSTWFAQGVTKYHRTVATTLNALVDNGFSIVRVLEPHAVQRAEQERPELLDERRRPPFLLVKARRV